jgi:hypothetical protein
MRRRTPKLLLVCCALAMPLRLIAGEPWIEDSNRYTQMLVDVRLAHNPEYGSAQGLSQYDALIRNPTLADEQKERAERDAVIERIKAQLPQEKDRRVAEDSQILIHAIDLSDRGLDLQTRLDVPFINASERVFQGLKVLLDDQVAAERRPAGGAEDKYDDFTFDAVAWTLTAHEARPGHELQFDSMVEHGTSIARAQYAFNSTNAEGWGLYSEYLIEPYMPPEGELMSLDLRLLRAARAFLDPELQSGKVQPEDAYRILQTDVVLSHAFATEEVERFTFRSPGQANSYFYGYTRLLELRKETEKALGKKFDPKRFHDFILAQGLLPPDLMRQAVMQDFVRGSTSYPGIVPGKVGPLKVMENQP